MESGGSEPTRFLVAADYARIVASAKALRPEHNGDSRAGRSGCRVCWGVSRSPLTWWAVSVASDGSTAAVRVAEADSVTTA